MNLESGGRPRRTRNNPERVARQVARELVREIQQSGPNPVPISPEPMQEGRACRKGMSCIDGANLHNEVFAGKKVRVDSPQGRFTDAPLLNGRMLVKVTAVGKHLGYDFGKIEGETRILHVHMGLYGGLHRGAFAYARAARGVTAEDLDQGGLVGAARAD